MWRETFYLFFALISWWRVLRDDTASRPGPRVSRDQTVLLASEAEVVNTFVDDDGSVENTVFPGQRHQVILYAHEGDHILVEGDVAQVPHVPVLGARRPVVVGEGIEMTPGRLTVV